MSQADGMAALQLMDPWGEWIIAHEAESSALTIKSDAITASFEGLK